MITNFPVVTLANDFRFNLDSLEKDNLGKLFEVLYFKSFVIFVIIFVITNALTKIT